LLLDHRQVCQRCAPGKPSQLLVVLVCLAAILQRVLPLAGINWL
jgi:hypothetical protein